MTTKKTEPTLDQILEAIAKANSHPDPKAYAADVKKHLEQTDV